MKFQMITVVRPSESDSQKCNKSPVEDAEALPVVRSIEAAASALAALTPPPAARCRLAEHWLGGARRLAQLGAWPSTELGTAASGGHGLLLVHGVQTRPSRRRAWTVFSTSPAPMISWVTRTASRFRNAISSLDFGPVGLKRCAPLIMPGGLSWMIVSGLADVLSR